jgi:hypothetical protein
VSEFAFELECSSESVSVSEFESVLRSLCCFACESRFAVVCCSVSVFGYRFVC